MSTNRILIVEDELSLRSHLADLFAEQGFSIFTCGAVSELEKLITLPVNPVDVIILDRLLNGKDAGTLIPDIKTAVHGVKIMVLSAINTPAEKALLLDLGADDYLAKPFSGEELIARVRVLLRRNNSVLRVGNLLLNVEDRKIFIGDNEMQLTNKEFLFLKTLVQSPGKVFNKEHFYARIWEMSPDVESIVVDTTVNKLRRRFEELGASVEIKNARGVGYWIEE